MLKFGAVVIGGANLTAAEPTGSVRLQLKWLHQFQFAGYYAAESKGFSRPRVCRSRFSRGRPRGRAHQRGERALLVSFDEIAGAHARNLAAVGIDLDTHLANGRLKICSARTAASSIEEHLVRVAALHREWEVKRAELAALAREAARRSRQAGHYRSALRRQRSADRESGPALSSPALRS